LVVILAILDYRLALAVWTVHTFLLDSTSLFYISRLKCPVPYLRLNRFSITFLALTPQPF
ncbi:MAG: hypothetical protein ACKO3I_07670, partial [Synechococcales cyanobacterium]